MLLRAALRPGVEAVDAWRQWCATSDLDRLDDCSVQLLPQVYRNLQDAETDAGPEIGRLRGLHRRSWYRNQLVLRASAGVVEQLAAAGIRAMLVAGTAVALRHDPSLAARPIDDAGALLAASDIQRAREVLERAGWRLCPRDVPEARPRFRRLVNSRGVTFDLHTRLFASDSSLAAEGDVWEQAALVEWQGGRALVLDPVHQLLHLCVHGLRWRPTPEVRWIADAALILERTAGALDWQELACAADRHCVSLSVRLGLGYLRGRFGEPVPDAALENLSRNHVSLRERLEVRVLTRPPGRLLGGLPERGVRWLHSTHGQPWHDRLRGLPAFLLEGFDCDRALDLVRVVVRKAARRTVALAASAVRDIPR